MLADLDQLLIGVFCIADDLLPESVRNARRSVRRHEAGTPRDTSCHGSGRRTRGDVEEGSRPSAPTESGSMRTRRPGFCWSSSPSTL
jgi:hypothetical protein